MMILCNGYGKLTLHVETKNPDESKALKNCKDILDGLLAKNRAKVEWPTEQGTGGILWREASVSADGRYNIFK
jgi:hypothetical protein